MVELFTREACEKNYGTSRAGGMPALFKACKVSFPSILQEGQNQEVSPGRRKPPPLCVQGREVQTAVLPRGMEGTAGEQHMNSKTGLNLSIFPRFFKKTLIEVHSKNSHGLPHILD